MQAYPRTILEFREWSGTKVACRDYLARLRRPSGFVCPHCRATDSWKVKRELCWCARCELQTSVTAGTLFHDTHKPLRLWFKALWHVTHQKYGSSALGMHRLLGLGSYHTVWKWLHKLCRAMVRPGRDRPGGVVEVDEICIGGERSGKRGRGAAGKTLVLIAAQQGKPGVGRIPLSRVVNAAGESLDSAVAQMVEPGAEIHTDGWGGYNRLPAGAYCHR